MNGRGRLALRLSLAVALILCSWLTYAENQSFPHARHRGLFTSCDACHGKGADRYRVTQSDCEGCHDGVVRRKVRLDLPEKKPTNLNFDHDFHVESAGIDCATCHQAEGSDNRMDVVRPGPQVCLTCHDASAHLAADSPCTTCHMPLKEATTLSVERVAALPKPDTHAAPDFLSRHGAIAAESPEKCAVCHARESCERCHVNAEQVPIIQTLPRDARIASLVQGRAGNWPRPASHDDPMWSREHGRKFSAEACSDCHVRESCAGCHAKGTSAAWLRELPAARANGPTGAVVPPRKPPGHDAPDFARKHAAAAASDNPRCASCHQPDFCSSCHNAPVKPAFHADNYAFRHAADVYAGDMDCAACHSREVFCRDCHEKTGMSPSQPRTAAFHDAEPFWLIGHGRAAREGMESCAACHQQKDCLPCHSAKSGWRVSPHGPDFNAQGVGDGNLTLCARCHFADPRPK